MSQVQQVETAVGDHQLAALLAPGGAPGRQLFDQLLPKTHPASVRGSRRRWQTV